MMSPIRLVPAPLSSLHDEIARQSLWSRVTAGRPRRRVTLPTMTNTTPPASGRTPSARRGVTPARQKLTDQLKWKKWKCTASMATSSERQRVWRQDLIPAQSRSNYPTTRGRCPRRQAWVDGWRWHRQRIGGSRTKPSSDCAIISRLTSAMGVLVLGTAPRRCPMRIVLLTLTVFVMAAAPAGAYLLLWVPE